MLLIAESFRLKSKVPVQIYDWAGERHGSREGNVATINFVLLFLLGFAAGYIWRDQISRFRHERARTERRMVRRMMSIFDPNRDGTYRPLGWPRE
jgi:hypothetical protein